MPSPMPTPPCRCGRPRKWGSQGKASSRPSYTAGSVGGVPQSIADPGEREHKAGDEAARHQGRPSMGRGQQVGVFLDDVAPRWDGIWAPRPRSSIRLNQDGRGKIGGAHHHQRPRALGTCAATSRARKTVQGPRPRARTSPPSRSRIGPTIRPPPPTSSTRWRKHLPESLAKRQRDGQHHQQWGPTTSLGGTTMSRSAQPPK